MPRNDRSEEDQRLHNLIFYKMYLTDEEMASPGFAITMGVLLVVALVAAYLLINA